MQKFMSLLRNFANLCYILVLNRCTFSIILNYAYTISKELSLVVVIWRKIPSAKIHHHAIRQVALNFKKKYSDTID